MKKMLGFILIIVGAVIVLLSFQEARSAIGLSLPAFASNNVLMVVGAVVLIAGVLLNLKKKGNKQQSEVPIYHGKNIVGYRRV